MSTILGIVPLLCVDAYVVAVFWKVVPFSHFYFSLFPTFSQKCSDYNPCDAAGNVPRADSPSSDVHWLESTHAEGVLEAEKPREISEIIVYFMPNSITYAYFYFPTYYWIVS